MMMIKVLRIKLLLNFVGPRGHVPHQNGMGTLSWKTMLLDNSEPWNYEEVMAGPVSNKWLEAMQSEIGSMYENKVWTLTDLPDDWREIENKWIFKKKTDTDGNVTVF